MCKYGYHRLYEISLVINLDMLGLLQVCIALVDYR